jgi:hypothetical protein
MWQIRRYLSDPNRPDQDQQNFFNYVQLLKAHFLGQWRAPFLLPHAGPLGGVR